MSTITFRTGNPPQVTLAPNSGRSLPAPQTLTAKEKRMGWVTPVALCVFWQLFLLAYAAPYIATVHLGATWLFGSWYR